jgi:hypothetical protein
MEGTVASCLVQSCVLHCKYAQRLSSYIVVTQASGVLCAVSEPVLNLVLHSTHPRCVASRFVALCRVAPV